MGFAASCADILSLRMYKLRATQVCRLVGVGAKQAKTKQESSQGGNSGVRLVSWYQLHFSYP
jgi:hypothetical protein